VLTARLLFSWRPQGSNLHTAHARIGQSRVSPNTSRGAARVRGKMTGCQQANTSYGRKGCYCSHHRLARVHCASMMSERFPKEEPLLLHGQGRGACHYHSRVPYADASCMAERWPGLARGPPDLVLPSTSPRFPLSPRHLTVETHITHVHASTVS